MEGNDIVSSPWNRFSVEVLNLMGEISQLAKRDGYIVTIAPAQSYLDVETNLFDRDCTHVAPWKPDFPYHGHNTYAPILAKYGSTQITHPNGQTQIVPTFDFISIQLYEGWSRANNVINNHMSAADYIVDLVEKMLEGWEINFSSDPDIGIETQRVRVIPTQLVIGLANGWAGPRPEKFLLVYGDEARQAYEILTARGIAPRGFMFWSIFDEGTLVNGVPLYLAKDLNSFLKIRPN